MSLWSTGIITYDRHVDIVMVCNLYDIIMVYNAKFADCDI